MKRSTRILVALLPALWLTSAPAPAFSKDPSTVSASDKAAARAAMDLGNDHFDEGQHAAALAKYLEADAIMGVPSTGILVGKAHEALGQLVEARDADLAVGRYKHTPGEPMPDLFVEAQELAAARANELATRIPMLEIVIVGLPPGVTPEVKLNGEPINAASLTRRVNPGEVTVSAKAAGYGETSASERLAEGDEKTLTIALARDERPAPEAPDPAPPTEVDPIERDEGTLVPAIVAFSVGGLALAAGAITGFSSIAKESDLEALCAEKICSDEAGRDELSMANTLANVSNVTLAVGGVGVALGVVFIFVFSGDDDGENVALTPILSPELLGVAGSF